MPSAQSLFIRSDDTLRAAWKVGLFLTVNGLSQDAVRALLLWSGFIALRDWPLQLWSSLALTLLLSWLFVLLEGRLLATIGLRLDRRWAAQCLTGMIGGGLLMACVSVLILGLGGFHWVMAAGGGPASLGSGAWLFLAVALREELLFRGYAFQRLIEGTGKWPALGLASLFFAYAHGNNPGMTGTTQFWATLNIALVGVLLGLCYLKTRSLAMSIGLHLGWNWTQGSLLGFGVSGIRMGSLLEPVFHGRPLWLTGGSFGLEASLPCSILCCLAIAGLALWKPVNPEEEV